MQAIHVRVVPVKTYTGAIVKTMVSEMKRMEKTTKVLAVLRVL